jgi:hypothetical protein
VRTFLGSESDGRLRALLDQDINWTQMLQSAYQHGLMPQLYWTFSKICPEAVPPTILDQMKKEFDFNLRRNLRLTGELLKVLEFFDAHGIPVIPFKGPVLASYLYGNIALRQFIDLDILVPKKEVLKAKDLLISQGYKPLYSLNRPQEAALLRTDIEYVFYRTGPMVSLEIHWRFDLRDSSLPLDFEGLWMRCGPMSLAGRGILHPTEEDLLLILCAHASKHMLKTPKLKWICDVAQLVRVNQGMDWDRIISCVTTSPARRLLFPVLFLSRDLLGAPLPDEVWQKVQQDPAIRRLAGQMRERLSRWSGALPGAWEATLFALKLRHGVKDRLLYCVGLMTPTPADYICMPLPEHLFLLYYLFRPLRLTAKYALKGASYAYDRCKRG